MKRQFYLFLLAGVLALAPLPALAGGGTAAAAAAGQTADQAAELQVIVDGKQLSLSPRPYVAGGTTLVPMRPIFNALYADVTWEPATKTIIAVRDETAVTLQLGSKNAVVGGKHVSLAAAPQIVEGATMVPLRFVAEALGAKVEADAAAHAVRITSYEAQLAQEMSDEDGAEDDYESVPLASQDVVDQNDDKVVMISTDVSQGSGVVIADNWVITNLHVMKGASEASVTLQGGDEVDVEGIVGYDENSDLAIIQTKKSLDIDPVAIGFGASKGEHVIAIGSPLGLQNTVSDGVVSNVSAENGVQMYQISVPIDHGSSGGGLFNDYGQLVGITSSGIDSTHADLNFAVSVVSVSMLIYTTINDDSDRELGFLAEDLPDTLKGASDKEIQDLIGKSFSSIDTSQGTTKLSRVEASHDAAGWLVVSAVIDPSFYMLYGHKADDDLRYWAIDAGYKLHKLLPDDVVQLTVYYEQTFSFKPRDLDPSEVTDMGDGTWRVRYPVISMQGKEKMLVQVRA